MRASVVDEPGLPPNWSFPKPLIRICLMPVSRMSFSNIFAGIGRRAIGLKSFTVGDADLGTGVMWLSFQKFGKERRMMDRLKM